MKNKFLTFIAALTASGFIYAQQTGINTKTPTTTLQVVGDPANTAVADGITVPNLTGDQLRAKNAEYTAAQRGTTVYVTAADTAPAGQTINVTAAGYYYYDGALWQRVATPSPVANTIYNADGTLTGNRSVTQGNFDLNFDANTLVVDGSANRVGIGTNAPIAVLEIEANTAPNERVIETTSPGGTFRFVPELNDIGWNWLSLSGDMGFIFSTDNDVSTTANNGLVIAPHVNGPATPGIKIMENGNVGIGANAPTETLDVNGQARVRNLPGPTNTDVPVHADNSGNLKKGYRPGEVISVKYFSSFSSSFSTPDGPVTFVNSATSGLLYSIEYTPVDTNSMIIAQFDCDYRIDGFGTDSYYSSLYVLGPGGGVVAQKSQEFVGTGSGGGTRGGTLTPIQGAFNFPNTTNPITIRVRLTKDSTNADDINIGNGLGTTVANFGFASFIVTEIAR